MKIVGFSFVEKGLNNENFIDKMCFEKTME